MAKQPKRNKRATLDVTADMLPMIGLLLPSGYAIAGSETMQGVVRLVLEGADVTEDCHLQMIQVDEGNQRRLELKPAEVKPPVNA